MDPLTLLGFVGPLVVEGGRALINRFIAAPEFKPATVEQWALMRDKDREHFAAVNAAGGNNPSYPWVEAVIRLQRPVIGGVVLVVWAYLQLSARPDTAGVMPDLAAVNNAAATIWFYLFGDRTLAKAQSAARRAG